MIDFRREGGVLLLSSSCPEEVDSMHRDVEGFIGKVFAHKITTKIVGGDIDNPEAVMFEVLRGNSKQWVVMGPGNVNRDDLKAALEAVAEHDAIEEAFKKERSKGNDPNVWRLQTLRKVMDRVNEALPKVLRR